jgi:hypothetical protein
MYLPNTVAGKGRRIKTLLFGNELRAEPSAAHDLSQFRLAPPADFDPVAPQSAATRKECLHLES